MNFIYFGVTVWCLNRYWNLGDITREHSHWFRGITIIFKVEVLDSMNVCHYWKMQEEFKPTCSVDNHGEDKFTKEGTKLLSR